MVPYSYPSFPKGAVISEKAPPSRIFDGFAMSPGRKPVYSNLIGRKIAKLRYTRGWTQDTLVAKLQVLQCNITRHILANIETKRSVATSVHCFFLAKVFGVSTDELFRP